MSIEPFDLGLTDEDRRAMREARLARVDLDRDAALRLISDTGPLVDAAVRRRPLFSGAPFTLPSHEDEPLDTTAPWP
jgi:hypothetical protein